LKQQGSSAPVVRDAVRADAERVAAMVALLTATDALKHRATFTAADFRRDGFGAKARFRCIVAELDAAIVGYACWYPAYDMTTATHGLHLLDLFVTEHARGKGCGTALIRAVARRAAAAGGKWVCLHVRPANTRAFDLYRRLGATDLRLRFLAFDEDVFPALADA
jgi:ribosomal protein S18 acetylase RimI-like enzyme